MAKREISTRFRLEGEREFNAAIKDAANNIKVLNSEQKLAEAQFNLTGDAQEYAAEKARILKDKIEEQKKQVEACETAIRKMTEQGVKPNDDAMVKWRTKLNNAKTTLLNMERQLDSSEKELKENAQGMADAGNKSVSYKQRLQDLTGKLKLLDEEQKLAEAQFKKTGDQQQYAADKARILKEKIEAQKEQVAVCEEAIKSLTENGVEENAAEMVQWRTKLIQAKTKLNEMETELGEVETGLGETGEAMGGAGKTSDDYKTKLQNVTSKLKLLDEEQKLAEAQFKKTGDKEQYAADKAKILREKIEEQKKQVEICEAAIKSLTENGVEENAAEMVQWRTKLIQSKAKLNEMETELGEVETGLGETGEAMDTAGVKGKNLDDTLEGIGKNVSFDTLKSGLGDVTRGLETVIRTAARAAKAVWDVGIDASQWADEVSTSASQFGVDVETYQAMQYASRFIDTGVNDILGARKKLISAMASTSEETAKTFNALGVVTRGAGGKVRDANEVFWDTIDALGRVTDETTRDIYAQQLLGKSYDTLKPLIEAGATAYANMMEQGRKNAVVSEKNVQQLGGLNDEYENLMAVWDKTKYDALAALAPTLQDVAKSMTQVLTGLDQFVQSEEGRAAIEGIGDALSGIVDSFLGDDNGKGSFESIVTKAKDAVNLFTDAMSWIADNGNTVKAIIEGLAMAWAACKVSQGVLTFLQLANNLPISKIRSLHGLFGTGAVEGAAKGAATAAAGSAGGAGTAAGAAGGGWLSTALSGLVSSGAAGTAGFVGVTAAIGAVLDKAASAREQAHYQNADVVAATRAVAAELDGETARATESLAGLYEVMAKYGTSVDGVKEIKDALLAMSDADLENLHELAPDLELWERMGDVSAESMRRLMGTWNEEWQVWDDPLIDAMGVMDIARDAMDKIGERFANGEFAEVAGDAVDGYVGALEEGAKDAEGAGADIGDATIDGTRDALQSHSPSRRMMQVGYDAADGFILALERSWQDSWNAGFDLAQAAEQGMRAALDIRSPSRVMAQLGQYTAEGYAEGVDAGIARVQAAVGRMAGATARRAVPVSPVIAGRQGAGAAGAGGVNATIIMDKTVVGRLVAPAVNDTIGAQISAMRR